jgi:hypothetical protein
MGGGGFPFCRFQQQLIAVGMTSIMEERNTVTVLGIVEDVSDLVPSGALVYNQFA